MSRRLREISDDAFSQTGPTVGEIKAALLAYVDENPDTTYDLGQALDEEDPDEIMKAAYRVLNNKGSLSSRLVEIAEGKDLEDQNDVGDLMSSFCELVLEELDMPDRMARLARSHERLKDRPHDPDRDRREVDRDYINHKDRLGLGPRPPEAT